MPVILGPETARRWVRPGAMTQDEMAAFCRPFPAMEMVARRISTLVNNVRNDGPEVLGEID
jgi:putative SOS response-associated peptidase YedK